jgi:histidinol-phosphate aminotransferase
MLRHRIREGLTLMQSVTKSNDRLDGLVPYDPKYLPAKYYLSANENPHDLDTEIKTRALEAISGLDFNRYPDPLANDLRDIVADSLGLARSNVLFGNGGDELLFNTALAWGGPGRTFLNFPPTFSVYAANARLTGTDVVDIPRKREQGYAIDQKATLDYLRNGGKCDFTIVTSPNNPTGQLADDDFIEDLLNATDALVMVDEAYFEFSRHSVVSMLAKHRNLVILRTFSKAYSLAGVRLGYILAHPDVIDEYLKVRQPYSVDAVSQAIAKTAFESRDLILPVVDEIIAERGRVRDALSNMNGLYVYPSDSNWLLVEFQSTFGLNEESKDLQPDSNKAQAAWDFLYDKGILVRDFSKAAMLEGCLRITIGDPHENDALLDALVEFCNKGAA